MKRIISILLAAISVFTIFSVNVFAEESVAAPANVLPDEIIEEVHGLYDTNNNESMNPKATGLITEHTLTLAKTTDRLIIYAKTDCIESVRKCGFTYIKLQRLINGSWTNYTAYCYYDQYANSSIKTFSQTVSAPKGYTYRVVCEHYAEKAKLIFFKETETIYNVTSSLVF
ncbi:MAG: hypothetical protein ACOYJX_10105 [Acutalibacteraceae bacterium]|jgi:hypothetical protein